MNKIEHFVGHNCKKLTVTQVNSRGDIIDNVVNK